LVQLHSLFIVHQDTRACVLSGGTQKSLYIGGKTYNTWES